MHTNTRKRIYKYTFDTWSGIDRSSVARSILSFRCMTATRRPTNSWDAFVDDKLCRRVMNDEVLRRKRRMGGCINASAAWSVVLMKSRLSFVFWVLTCFLSRVCKPDATSRPRGKRSRKLELELGLKIRYSLRWCLCRRVEVWGIECQCRHRVPRANAEDFFVFISREIKEGKWSEAENYFFALRKRKKRFIINFFHKEEWH